MIFADGHLDPGTEKCAVKPNRGRKGMQCICRRPFHPHVVIVYPMYFQSKNVFVRVLSRYFYSVSFQVLGFLRMNKRLELREKSLKQQPETEKGQVRALVGGMVAIVFACTFLVHFCQKNRCIVTFLCFCLSSSWDLKLLSFFLIMILALIFTWRNTSRSTQRQYLASDFVVMFVSKIGYPSK